MATTTDPTTENGTGLALAADKGVLELVLELEKGGAIDTISLTLTDPEMTYDRWEALGKLLGRVDRASRWWIGDWLNFGEALYGEKSAQAIETTQADRYKETERVTGLDHGTLLNISSICRKVARSRRRPELGFWIHGEVSALEPQEQIHWLQRAVDESLTKSELRAAIKGDVEPEEDPEPAEGGTGNLTVAERLEQAARHVYHQWERAQDGSYIVPAEAAAQLIAALGEE